jgi:hypothetical protein
MSRIKVVEQNKCVGKLKEIYLVIHVDKEGNEGVFAEGCFRIDSSPKVAPELTPYAKELPFLEKYVEELNEKLGVELGMIFKIKKFFAPESFN